MIRKQGFARSKKDLELMNQVIKKYSKLNYNELHFNDKYYLNYINTVFYTSSGDNLKSLIYTKRNIDLLESISAKLRDEEFEKHIVTLNNHVVNLINIQKTDEINPYLEEIRSLATHNIRENMLLWITSYKLVLGVTIKSGDYEQAERIAEEINEGINQHSEKIPSTDIALFKFNMAIVYFVCGKYAKAIKMLNEIINDNELSLRDDIQSFARIIRLIIFWEKGEEELLPYATLSTYRFLYKRKKLYKFESIVLQFIREKMPHINTSGQQRAAFIELKEKLENQLQNPLEKKALDYFDFITWIESKITKKDFKLLAREKMIS
jgi:tetratricopeptide (TPR) repeat protein